MSALTWEGFWLPNLIQWFLGGAAVAIVGGVVGWALRRMIRRLFGQHQATAEDTLIEARAAADNASTANQTTEWVRAHIEPLLLDHFKIEQHDLKLEEFERNQRYILANLAKHETSEIEARRQAFAGPLFTEGDQQ